MCDFRQRFKHVVEDFLQTAIIVDDQACIDDHPFRAPGPLKKPDRHTLVRSPEAAAEEERVARHNLNARVIVDSFSECGLICAVMVARSDTPSAATVAHAAKRADIVVLDWQLEDDNGKRALSIIGEILEDDAGERLRLIAVYTGEQDISGIGQTIVREMGERERVFRACDQDVVLSYRHCRIVIYAKADTPLGPELTGRSISEADIPKRLISDFAEMTEGLLPSVALTSLAAVRENAHRILDRFHRGLDAAFLAHRACLPVPSDSQQHMVSQIAGELHAIMDDAVAREDPLGLDACKEWLAASAGQGAEFTFGEDKKLSFDETFALLNEGLESTNVALKVKDFKFLSSGFAGNKETTDELDRQLAWTINFRTVFNAPPPILQLGTVLQKDGDSDESSFFLCMRPRCDCVRLQGEDAFLLLPLIQPEKNTIQLVIRTRNESFRRVSVCTKASRWSLVRFKPKIGGEPVTADRDENKEPFFFTSVDGAQYCWVGELKAQFAQRIAHRFASGLSRVATDNSEWLRRMEDLRD